MSGRKLCYVDQPLERARRRSQVAEHGLMNKPSLAACCALTALLLANDAWGQAALDRVRRTGGVDSGQITATTPLGLTLTRSGVATTIAAEDIVSVTLAGEPAELNSARNAVLARKFAEAAEILKKVDRPAAGREELLAEIDFYSALVGAKLASGGSGAPQAAAESLRSFMAKHRTSFHVPQAIEALGDLLGGTGQYAAARAEYAKLAKAKSEYYAMRSAWLSGRAWLAEGDAAKAAAELDRALAAKAGGELAERVQLLASLDRAVARAKGGDAAAVDDAVHAIAKLIAAAAADDDELLASAYTALGDCYLSAKDERAALFAFLHVDLLFPQTGDLHARALHELVGLWKATGKDSRSQEAAAELAKRYPSSKWANDLSP